MFDIGALPHIINEQILRYAVQNAQHPARRLALLSVCSAWRQLSLPLVHGALCVCGISPPASTGHTTWPVDVPALGSWRLNLSSFNAHDISTHARYLLLSTYPAGFLEDLPALLAHVFSLLPAALRSVRSLDITTLSRSADHQGDLREHVARQLAALLVDRAPHVTELRLDVSVDTRGCDLFYTELIAAYAQSLCSLHLLSPVILTSPVHLASLTTLDVVLADKQYDILSAVSPPSLRSLSLTIYSPVYIWNHFTLPEPSADHLCFDSLTDLRLCFNFYISKHRGGSYHDDQPRWCYLPSLDQWDDPSATRRVSFPALNSLTVQHCHLASVICRNCDFPKRLSSMRLLEHINSRAGVEWLLDRISADVLSLTLGVPDGDSENMGGIDELLGPEYGDRLTVLKLLPQYNLPKTLPFLPSLVSLNIYRIKFIDLVTLLPALPCLLQCILGSILFCSTLGNRLREFFRLSDSSPLSSSLTLLNIEFCYFTNEALGIDCLNHLVSRLTRLHARTRSQAVTSPTSDRAPAAPPKRGRLSRKSDKAQDNSERALVLRRLVDALHDGDFDNELGASKEEGNDDSESDADYAPDEGANEDEVLEKKEKKLILRIKMSKIRERNGTSNSGSEKKDEMCVEDVDWPEFDAETINGILQRREELRKQRGTTENMARLKKSSLAPPPLQLEKARPKQLVRAGSEEGEEVEGMEVDDTNATDNFVHGANHNETDAEEEEEEEEDEEEEEEEALGELFDDVTVAAGSLAQGSLHLPLRAMESTEEGMLDNADQQQIPPHLPQSLRHPVPEAERSGPPRDMRLELQNELQREEQVLKDLRAEIIDKLFKLQTEEKLLRMIVRHDFDIPDDEMLPNEAPALAEANQMDVVDDQANPDYAAIAAAAAAAMEVVNQSGLGQHDDVDSDDASSLSGMSSSSSEDEIQDDEVTRGALSRVLDQYLPDGDWPNNSE
ncbi:hypothetical protein LPJ53_000602 [Coemansia erecta]|uniref:Uncharacterized protein n=1 Tax=Coemansia erecta TaxID=147472 RepID=A0A9W7Y762_9FUNG|nr:hypothetical protein LPJ53_000602 [Coemansia erecta]